MGEFQRSPSKVWWGSEALEWREHSASPGSQDSGFSDTESSNNSENQQKKETPAKRIPKEIFKELKSDENLSSNFKEKTTPSKVLINGTTRLAKTEIKKDPLPVGTNSEPSKKHRYTKHSPKVSRNLFNTKPKESSRNATDNQYAGDVTTNTCDDSIELQTQSLPIVESDKYFVRVVNKSAPPDLDAEDEAVTSFNSLSSDDESELECLFGPDSPKHTSTPKAPNMRHFRQKLPLNLYLKYQEERVPPIKTETDLPDNKAVLKWMEEAKYSYEQECMTTLQCKSIMSDLGHKVSQLAAATTENIRDILQHARTIELEYQNLNSETIHLEPLIQSLAGNILDFLKRHTQHISSNILVLHDTIKKPKTVETLKLVSKLFTSWQDVLSELLTSAVKDLVDKLECPKSDLDLRATTTGITSIALRHEELIETFTKLDVIPILVILCEKCEGSSLRSLLLRSLTTMCMNASAVRQFEKYSGVELIADTVEEESRPEPERSEAVALLAQVTAPWIEDNHNVKGLAEYSHRLVESLTKFAGATKCCQNLLLCAAALANLSSMDPTSIIYMVEAGTIDVFLMAVKVRGPGASLYLLEQVATLIANMSAVESARRHLSQLDTSAALLYCLQACRSGEDVERRLQQKTMIALSRLCGDPDVAGQIVSMGGVDKLVNMCREKKDRFDSDAVLVAALATLRKIVDICGTDILSAQDAQELVEPKLLDSFLAYSTQNESYV